MTPEEQKAGKARVLRHLIEPIAKVQRMPRPRGVSEMEHLAGLAEIQQRLAHLSFDELRIVREAVIEGVRSKAGKVAWPPPAVVIAIGLNLRLPDAGDTERVRSCLVWAVRKGVLPSEDYPWLYLWLRKNVGLPSEYQLRQLVEQADADRRALNRIKREADEGVAMSTADADLRSRVLHAQTRVAEIVDAAKAEVA